VAVLVISMDLAPLSRALLAAIPPLKSFRVPERAILPWLWAVAVLASAALVDRRPAAARESAPAGPRARRPRGRRAPRPAAAALAWWRPLAVLAALPLAAGLWLLPSVAREAAVWVVAGFGLALLFWRRGPAVPVVTLALVLGAGSVAAFGERLLPFPDGQAVLTEARRIGEAVRGARPGLSSSLTRVRLELAIPALATNTAFAGGLSALDGYGVPTRRFAALLFALRGQRYEPTAVFFNLPPTDPAFAALRQLYDVAWQVTVPSRDRLSLEPLGATAGAAWFSASVVQLPDLATLARELRDAGGRLHERAAEVLWLDASDPRAVAIATPTGVEQRCRDARVSGLRATARAGRIVARVTTPAACPLTLAMNYTEDLRATVVRGDGSRQRLAVAPGYGALASVLVPEAATEVVVEAEAPRLLLAPAWMALGVVCWVAAAGLTWRWSAAGP
jgi:hypothetical protein